MINLFEKRRGLVLISVFFLLFSLSLVNSYTPSTGEQETPSISYFPKSISSWWNDVKETFSKPQDASRDIEDISKQSEETQKRMGEFQQRINEIDLEIAELEADRDKSDGWGFGVDTSETKLIKQQIAVKEAEKAKYEKLIKDILAGFSGEEESKKSSFSFSSLFSGGVILSFDRLYNITELFLVPAIIVFFILRQILKFFPGIPILSFFINKARIIVGLVLYGLMLFFWGFIRGGWLLSWVSNIFVYTPMLVFYKIIYSFGAKNSAWSLVVFIISLIIYVVIVWIISKNLDKIRRLYRRARGKEEAEKLAEETKSAKRIIQAINKGAKEKGFFEVE